MGPLGPAIVGGIATIGGALIGGHGQSEANAANAAEAQRNRDFQERMRSTQYQTAVDDMRKAGLNPALAYQQGGSGNLSGSTATYQNTAAGAGASAAQALSTIQDMRRNAAEIDNVVAQTENLRETKQILNQDLLLKVLEKNKQYGTYADQISRIQAEARTATATAKEADASARIRELGIPEAQAIAEFYRTIMGKASPFVSSAGKVVVGLSQLGRLFRR